MNTKKLILRCLFLFFLNESVHSMDEFDKYNLLCKTIPPYHLSIYSDNINYYVNVKITNSFPIDIWIPTESGALAATKELEFILHVGKFYNSYLMAHDTAPKTEKIEIGKQYSTIYRIEKESTDNFLEKSFGSVEKVIVLIRLSLVKIIEGTKIYGDEGEYDAYMENTCVIKLTTHQKLPTPINDG